ncbi:MAG: DUF2341 domain-containing protein [Methanobacteriota archaeon]
MKKILCTILIWILLTSTLTLIPQQVHAEDLPTYQNQGQNKTTIRPGESITLSAQGRDNDGLQWSWLATNETGRWVNISGWWNRNWGYSKKIVIDHTKIQSNLTDFPIIVNITSPDFITHAQTDGDDFVFISGDNTTKYDHEIESYTSTTGKLIAWVKIPSLSSTSDTNIYVYYGNPTCNNQQNVAATWSNGFIMVHHMTGGSYTELKDSTSNHWDITSAVGDPLYNQDGKIGSCVKLYPPYITDYLKVGDFRLPADSTYTASAWVDIDLGLSSRYIFSGDSNHVISMDSDTTGKFRTYADTDTDFAYCYSTTRANWDTWYHVCARVDSVNKQLALFINGTNEATDTFTGAVVPENIGLNIGANRTEANCMYGRIDEIRISNTARSDAWIKTEYAMMASSNTFLSTGVEQTPRGGGRYGSPKQMQGTTQWQWSNFTWQNSLFTQEKRVGWRIYFEDTLGNTIGTPIMSFMIIDSPPNTPSQPQGQTSGYVETEYSFTVNGVIDPNGDDVAYWFDWGDGTNSGWTAFHPSGTGASATHIWQTTGSYTVRVKAKDVYSRESSWSPGLNLEITPLPLPQLTVNMLSSVQEGDAFHVQVTGNGVPLMGALVLFSEGTYYTNTVGMVNLTAPLVSSTREYTITVSHDQFLGKIMTLIVINIEEELEGENGWIYGRVYDTDHQIILDVTVSVKVTETTTQKVSTGEQGYSVLVPMGVYTVIVSKKGYLSDSISGVIVQKNEATEVNFVLTMIPRYPSGEPVKDEQRDLIETVITMGISNEKVGSTVDCVLRLQTYNITLYVENLRVNVTMINQTEVSLKIGGEDLPGTVIALRLFSEGDVADVDIMYDGARIDRVSFADIFSFVGNGSEAKYTRVLSKNETGEVMYCLIYVPHFSEHDITIRTIQEAVLIIGGVVAVVLYLVVCVMVASSFLYPVFSGTIMRRRRK